MLINLSWNLHFFMIPQQGASTLLKLSQKTFHIFAFLNTCSYLFLLKRKDKMYLHLKFLKTKMLKLQKYALKIFVLAGHKKIK